MRRTVTAIIILGAVLGAASCSSSASKKAELDFRHVNLLLKGNEYTAAMQLLDSMMVWNQNDFGVVGQAMRKRDSIAGDYHRQVIRTSQDLLASVESRILPLTRDFRFIPGEAGIPGTYEHRRQSVESSWNRIFLKINLNEKGDIWLMSHYYGKSWIDHVSLRVYDQDNFVLSDTIPLGDPRNRKVEDMGDKWETIEFHEGADAGIIAFIADNYLKSIKVRFNGKTFQYIVLESYDKEAIRKGWELAQLLKEKDGLMQTIDLHQKELRKIGAASGS
ncbi:MAG: hypothetical protein V2A67_05190 [Bacteroidota bacterium]